MRPLARWGSLPLLATPFGTWALGLGEIELHSALNQPLDAEIALVSATPEELASLDVSLAPLASFQRYGLDRPAFLTSLEFEIGRNAAGQDVVRVTSTQSIAEPFVTILVEADWARGRLLREYTVFLDPPVLLPQSAGADPVTPPASREPASAAGPINRPAPAPTPVEQVTPAPAPQPAEAPAAPATSVAGSDLGGSDGSTYGPVQSGETLWAIASTYRPAGVSINQAMIAIFRANPEAFSGNINILQRGAILRIPAGADMSAIAAGDATAEVQRQIDEWRPGGVPASDARLVLVPPTEVPTEDAPAEGSAAGQDGAETAELESPVDASESGLAESDGLLEVTNTELAELQEQLAVDGEADLAAVIDPPEAADPGVELESEAAVDETPLDTAVDPDNPFEEPLADVAPPAEQAEADAPAEEPQAAVTPPAVPAATTQTPAESPSLVDRVVTFVTSTAGLIGGGLLLILVGAFLFLRRRRAEVDDATGEWEALEADLDPSDEDVLATSRMRAEADEDFVVEESAGFPADDGDADPAAASGVFAGFEDQDAEVAPAPTPVAAAPEAADEAEADDEASQTLSSNTVINLEQADPLAEADFHMAYGLYDQAAELVQKALEADPHNVTYRQKLLEVYFVWGNKDAFVDAAGALKQDLGDDPGGEWGKVVIMGKQICPDDPMFADSQAAVSSDVDLDLEAGAEPDLDLAFDGTDAGAADGGEFDLDVDFDSTLAETAESAADELLAPSDEPVASADEPVASADVAVAVPEETDLADDSLDIGESTQAGLEAALFDVDESAEKTTPGLEAEAEDDASLAETIESPTVEADLDIDFGDDEALSIADSQTVEALPAEDDSPTVEAIPDESVTAAEDDDVTVETPTIETQVPASDMTAELELGDLGLDVTDLEGLDDVAADEASEADALSATAELRAVQAGEELLSATGVTQVLGPKDVEEHDLGELTNSTVEAGSPDDDTMLAAGFSATHADTEVISRPDGAGAGGDDLDLDLDDLSQALDEGDTVEQETSGFDPSLFEDASETPVDIDLGDGAAAVADTLAGPMDAQTMTEVGTKLDLARAYIDMGDPDGAKSILEEVLSEGDTGQRQEAQTLIDALPAA